MRPQGTSSPPTPDEDAETRAAARPAYLAFVAHEMRNPLSTALWSAELLGRMSAEERGGARGEKLAGMCLRTLARLRHLVEDHFLAERLAIAGIPLRGEPLSLAEVVSKAAHRAGIAPASIEVQELTVLADRAMIERAVETLLARVARDDAAVRVSAVRAADVVSLRVQGAPLPEDVFRAPDRSTPSDPTGRALGVLAACEVAAAHGGSLVAVEDGFLLSLPVGEGAVKGGGS